VEMGAGPEIGVEEVHGGFYRGQSIDRPRSNAGTGQSIDCPRKRGPVLVT
jgi:hypothetical protein